MWIITLPAAPSVSRVVAGGRRGAAGPSVLRPTLAWPGGPAAAPQFKLRYAVLSESHRAAGRPGDQRPHCPPDGRRNARPDRGRAPPCSVIRPPARGSSEAAGRRPENIRYQRPWPPTQIFAGEAAAGLGDWPGRRPVRGALANHGPPRRLREAIGQARRGARAEPYDSARREGPRLVCAFAYTRARAVAHPRAREIGKGGRV